ncbi:hypothetical protein MMC22_009079 [Lobaria immixta]|nr:hypothetical protein [Lobaria immixta]
MDRLNQIDEADQTDLQPSSVEMDHSPTGRGRLNGNLFGPGRGRGRPISENYDIAVPTREQMREMFSSRVQQADSYLGLYEAETYGRPRGDPFAMNGHGIHRGRQETTNVEMAHPRNPDDPLPVVGSPIAFQPHREEGSAPNAGAEATGHSLAAHVRSEEAAAMSRQTPGPWDRLVESLESMEAGMSNPLFAPSDVERSDSAHDDQVPDLDHKASGPPPSIKTPKQMMVNLECKVCYEQTCNVVLFPCRK